MSFMLALLGDVRMSDGSGALVAITAPRQMVLLAGLALSLGKPVPRPELWALPWEDRAEAQARNSLRQLLTALRRIFADRGGAPLDISDTMFALDAERVSVDLDALAPGARMPPVPAYGEFLHGLHLPGAEFQRWLADQRQALQARYIDKLTAEANSLSASGAGPLVAELASAILDADPADEAAHRHLICHHLQNGDRPRALKQFELCRSRLRDTYGIEPDPRTIAVIEGRDAVPATGPPTSNAEPLALPALVVLPIAAKPPMPETILLAETLIETITGELSRFHEFRVVASPLAAADRNGQANVPALCAEFGAGFALGGTVQQGGDTVRLRIQLIDAADGQVHWTDRIDHDAAEGFALQVDLTLAVVARLGSGSGGQLRRSVLRRRAASGDDTASKYDHFARGLEFTDLWTPEGTREGRRFYRKTLDRDPRFAKARAKLAWTYLVEPSEAWGDDPRRDLERGIPIADEALKIDPHEPWAVWVKGGCEIYLGRHDEGLRWYQRAVELSPNDADLLLDYGYYLGLSGEPEAGLEKAAAAMRLQPRSPNWHLMDLMQIQFDRWRCEDAVATGNRLAGSETRVSLMLFAAAEAALCNRDGAAVAVGRVLAMDPDATVFKMTSPIVLPYRNPADRDRLIGRLREAELPDGM